MRMPGNIRVTQTLRRLRSHLRDGVAILGYHRLHAAPDPLYLSVDPRRFEQHLQAIARIGTPLALRDVASALAMGHVPRRAVVLTFDDGYADNLHVALPLLERYGMPATIFVTTGNYGGEFWWDRLARMAAAIPGDLEATAARLERLDDDSREAALQELEQRHAPWGGKPLHRALTESELEQLASSPLIEIGAHTESHQVLTSLPPELQRDEIAGCRMKLEALLGRPVLAFSYPHGALTPAVAERVAAAGYTVACCSRVDVAARGSSAFMLPRLWVTDCEGAAFERWLRGWVHG